MNSTRRSLWVVVPVALAVATTVAVANAGGTTPPPRHHARLAAQAVTTPVTAPVAHRSHRERTERLVARLLAALRVPHDARTRSHPPTKQLAHAAVSTASSNVVDRHRFWTLPGGPHRVLSYVERHGVRGCHFSGSGSSSGPGEPTVYEIFCDHRSTSYAYNPDVQVEAVATADGSAVRADATGVWYPHRPSRSYVRRPTAAHVVVARDAKVPGFHRLPTVRRDVPAGAAVKLAAVVDRQSVYPPVVEACPLDYAGVQDTVRFTTPSGPATVVVHLTGCPAVSVTTGHHETSLTGAAAVDAVVRHVLHLPKRYRP